MAMVDRVAKLALFGVVTGFVGYCVYFDHKRRSDPMFRAKLVQKRRERAQAEKSSVPDLPPMNDPRAVHRFFLERIQMGEISLSTGAVEEAVNHFAYAVVVCGQPTQLLQVLQQSLSPAIFSKLVSSLPAVRKVVMEQNKSSGVQIEEELE